MQLIKIQTIESLCELEINKKTTHFNKNKISGVRNNMKGNFLYLTIH